MKLIQELRQTTSRLVKEQILSTATEVEKKVLYYAYNPYLRYGISNIPADEYMEQPTEDLFKILDRLASKELSGNYAREVVELYADNNNCSLIYLICRKNLDCGITAKTINKVFPNLIPSFDVQLAKEVPIDELEYPMIAQIKYDGVRVIAISDGVDCELRTRNGKLINCPRLSRIINANNTVIGQPFVLDGEITVSDGKMVGRTSISGRINSALKGGELLLDDLAYNVFDYLQYDEFKTGVCYTEYSVRNYYLKRIVDIISSPIVKKAIQQTADNAEEANDFYHELLDEGYEGIILKKPNHIYSFKRSRDWVKVKSVKTTELECYGYVEGRAGTKYEGYIGALKCDGYVEGQLICVQVGSGLSDEDRQLDFKTNFLKKTIEVKYNDVIPSSDTKIFGTATLFLPRFVSVRFDK